MPQYTASSKAFFGPSFPASTSMPLFLKFDAAIPLLSLDALPSFLKGPALTPRAELAKLIVAWYSATSPAERESMAPSITGMRECAEADGWSEQDWATLVLSSLWALEANAPYGEFLVIVFVGVSVYPYTYLRRCYAPRAVRDRLIVESPCRRGAPTDS